MNTKFLCHPAVQAFNTISVHVYQIRREGYKSINPTLHKIILLHETELYIIYTGFGLSRHKLIPNPRKYKII